MTENLNVRVEFSSKTDLERTRPNSEWRTRILRSRHSSAFLVSRCAVNIASRYFSLATATADRTSSNGGILLDSISSCARARRSLGLIGLLFGFWVSQLLVEQGKLWPFGERPHGVPGLLESYGELIGTTDARSLLRYLDYLSKETVKGHWECPCGSKKRLRDCHLEVLKSLRQRISPAIAKKALNRLVST
jgi:hypothetical protein